MCISFNYSKAGATIIPTSWDLQGSVASETLNMRITLTPNKEYEVSHHQCITP